MPNPNWSEGQRVSLYLARLAKPAGFAALAKPAGFAAKAGDARATLTWANPNNPSITKYQYQQKVGSNAWGNWMDIPTSAPGEANATSYTVTRLMNGATYAFRVRAVDAKGPGPASDAATARLATTIWSATLTVDADTTGNFFGCDNSDSTQAACSVSTVLTDADFEYKGTTYTVNALYWISGNFSTNPNTLALDIKGYTGAATKTALASLTLNVDGTAFSVSAASGLTGAITWSYDPATDWTDGQKVKVSLRGPSGAMQQRSPPGAVEPLALQWARVNGAELALRFAAALDESSVPAGSAFSVSVAGSARSVSSVAVRQDMVTLTLSAAVSSGEAVTVGYTPPTQGSRLRRSGAGADVAAFSGTTVTNDTKPGQRQVQSPPGAVEPLTARIASAPSEHRGKGKFALRVAFSAPVAVRAKDAAVQVTGGTLARAARVDERKDLWVLTHPAFGLRGGDGDAAGDGGLRRVRGHLHRGRAAP